MAKQYEIFCAGVNFEALPEHDRNLLLSCSALYSSTSFDRNVDLATMLQLSEVGLEFVLSGIEEIAREDGWSACSFNCDNC